MKQNFNKKSFILFKNYFKIRDEKSEIEKLFYNKTNKYLKYIKWLPGLRMVWIWNSISMNCASKNSDIDLLIVTTPNSMWLNRIFITFIFMILWVRKTPSKHSSRFCLSFFATTDWLDFSSWKIQDDIYLYFWIVYFKPILNYNNTYELFIEKNSSWADFSEYNNIIEDNKNYIYHPLAPSLVRRGDNLDNFIIKLLDKILKKLFLPKTLKHYEKIWKPYWVIINDNMLKFHNWDIREEIKKELICD